MSSDPRFFLTQTLQLVQLDCVQAIVDNVLVANERAGILHVLGFIAIVCILGAMSEKHTASYVFTEFSNTSGWTNDGTSWLVGLLSTVYPFLGYVRSHTLGWMEFTLTLFQI